MKRVRAFFQGIKDVTEQFSAGREQLRRARAMREKVEAELAHVEAMQKEVQQAHANLPEALAKIKGEVLQMGATNEKHEEMIRQLQERSLTPTEMKEMLDDLEASKTVPNLGPLRDLMEQAAQSKNAQRKD